MYLKKKLSVLQEAEGGVYSTIWRQMSGNPVVTEAAVALDQVETGQYAFMTDRTQLEYIVLSDCETYALADEIFNTAGLGFVLPENAPFLKAFNFQLVSHV